MKKKGKGFYRKPKLKDTLVKAKTNVSLLGGGHPILGKGAGKIKLGDSS